MEKTECYACNNTGYMSVTLSELKQISGKATSLDFEQTDKDILIMVRDDDGSLLEVCHHCHEGYHNNPDGAKSLADYLHRKHSRKMDNYPTGLKKYARKIARLFLDQSF